MIGAPQEQILGKKTSEFVHPEDRPKLERLPGLERKTDSFEVRFLRSNGQVAHVLITSSPRHAENRALGSIAAMIDLTERKQAEMEREALIRELETKNAELERFTYTVSHDLKSPLITIRGFLGYLLADAEKGDLERLESDAKRITDATNRMQRLLDDLLELSRVGRLTHPPEDVSFGQIVQEALTIVEGRLAARRVQVQVEPRLPTVHVDRVRMVEVIQNLLDNAVKFMGEQAAPTIQIGMKIVGGEQAFFVADNGIGIESKYHEKIFGLFERLNPNVDGTGVGLALVKRIIELHGGKIWLESALGKGTTFYFTLASAT
jgi:signal transduction histidine kinase